MDYLILGFLAFAVLAFMWFKMKLALLDAATPKYGYPVGGQQEGGAPASIEARYQSSNIFSLLLVFGVIILTAYFMMRSGHQPNRITNEVAGLFSDDGRSRTNDEPSQEYRYKQDQAPNGLVAKNKEGRMNVPPTTKSEMQPDFYDQAEVNRAPRVRVSEGKITETPRIDPYEREVPVGGGFWLQAAALNSKNKAFELAAYYQDLDDLEARVVPEVGMYKVRIGPFRDRSAARETRTKYQKDWFIVED